MATDYSLYLVTDSTPSILGDRDLVEVVEAALEGGVTIVQYRDKTSETAELVRTAKRLHAVTRKYDVPLLINDRIDVALAVGVEGVHIGQDDMNLKTARQLLGPDAIIGVTVSSDAEAVIAVGGGASYLGIGTVYATPTKKDSKSIIGPAGVKHILRRLSSIVDCPTPTVAIGGIKESNVRQVFSECAAPKKQLDGFAIVSGIMAASDPQVAAAGLKTSILAQIHGAASDTPSFDLRLAIRKVPAIVHQVGKQAPLCHNMTNLVVQNFAANVALCIGASPIMANYGEEAHDLADLGGSLVVNMGTVTPDGLANYEQAITAYNVAHRPVLFDPVGAGATSVRRAAVKRLLKCGHFTVIKGNENEVLSVLGESKTQQKGVDSGESTLNDDAKAEVVQKLAIRERNVVLMTGKTDILSDGTTTLAIRNGHSYLGNITGSGCTLGTTVAAFLAASEKYTLLAALAGVLMYEIAAEIAAVRLDVKGPGTFVPAFLDELHNIKEAAKRGDHAWISAARVDDLSRGLSSG